MSEFDVDFSLLDPGIRPPAIGAPAPCRSIPVTDSMRKADEQRRRVAANQPRPWSLQAPAPTPPAARSPYPMPIEVVPPVEDEPAEVVAESEVLVVEVEPELPVVVDAIDELRTVMIAKTAEEHELNQLWALLSVSDRWAVLADAVRGGGVTG